MVPLIPIILDFGDYKCYELLMAGTLPGVAFYMHGMHGNFVHTTPYHSSTGGAVGWPHV